MIDHFGINCSDLAAAAAFYDQVLGVLGYTRLMDFGVAIGYGTAGPGLLDRRAARRGPGLRPEPGDPRRLHGAGRGHGPGVLRGRHRAGRGGAARAAALAGVPRGLLRRVRARPGRQQRRGGLPHRQPGTT